MTDSGGAHLDAAEHGGEEGLVGDRVGGPAGALHTHPNRTDTSSLRVDVVDGGGYLLAGGLARSNTSGAWLHVAVSEHEAQ